MSTTALTATMHDAVAYAQKHGGKMVRYPGGFWAREGWKGFERPWFGSPTVNALVDRGVTEFTNWKEGKRSRFPIEAKLKAGV